MGRGPSLLSLRAADFGPGPVLVLNHAILAIRKLGLPNPLYSFQKDGCLVRPEPPETLILSRAQSQRCFADYQPRYVIDVKALKLGIHSMSLTFAVAMAKVMGCTKTRLLAFDSYTNADFRTVVGEELRTIGRGYLHAANQALRYAGTVGIEVEWV